MTMPTKPRTPRTPKTRQRRRAGAVAAALAALALTAACGGAPGSAPERGELAGKGSGDYTNGSGYDTGAGSGYGSKPDDDARPAEPGAAADDQARATSLALRETSALGPVVTDEKGMTLYRFEKDTASPAKSACDGACATAWPPVPAGEVTARSGIAQQALGEVVRSDGSKQLTLGGRPVYRYAKDTAPGDTKGQGVGGTWFALAADGAKASAKPRPALSARSRAGLGEVLVDAKGRTLYRFTKDSAWPMKSACTGACLEKWKPAATVAKDRAEGVPAKLIGTLDRPDGTRQLAVDCWPLYWFTGDKQPGDANGQGVGGQWFAVGKDGRKITARASG